MKLFGFYISRRDPNATTHTVAAKGSKFADYNRHALKARGLRPGMWVMRPAADWPRAGILVGLNEDTIARVMLVQEDGTNLAEALVPGASLRQARYDEIPAARRQFPEGTAGYVRAPQ